MYVAYIYKDSRKNVDIEILAVLPTWGAALQYANDLCKQRDPDDDDDDLDLDDESEYVQAVDALFDMYCPVKHRRLAVQEIPDS
jgi:hypothetical protein